LTAHKETPKLAFSSGFWHCSQYRHNLRISQKGNCFNRRLFLTCPSIVLDAEIYVALTFDKH